MTQPAEPVTSGDHPPKPKFALTVGIIGHRPNRLPAKKADLDALSTNIEAALQAVAESARAAHARYDAYFDGGPELTLVSALAEGADRIAAHAAISLGFTLDAPLPFPQEIYEGDFPSTVAEFGGLLSHPRTRAVLALPGRKTPGLAPGARDAEAERAYEAVGLTVLGQSDVVLAIWDGKASAGRGGTTEMLQTAIRAGLPIIYVDANAQAPTKIIWEAVAFTSAAVEVIEEIPTRNLAALSDIVDTLVRPPANKDERNNLTAYFNEKRGRQRMRLEFPLLMALAMVRPIRRTDCQAPNPDVLAGGFAATTKKIAMPRQGLVLAGAFGWADALGVYFAQTFRGAFILSFAFGALAVLIAAVSLFFPALKWLFVLIEVLCISAVLINTYYANKRQLKRRWVEPREIAERLRVALPLWALGTRPNSFSGEEPSWTGWYVRALIRQQGMRSGSLAQSDAAREMLTDLLEDQCSYHRDVTAPRMKKLHDRLEGAGEHLFYSTLMIAALYLFFYFVAYRWTAAVELSEKHHELVKHAVAAISATFPAIATASYGIRVTGDFEGIALRSERTHAALARLLQQIAGDPPDLGTLRARARAGADAMLGDVSSWRLAAESRSLTL